MSASAQPFPKRFSVLVDDESQRGRLARISALTELRDSIRGMPSNVFSSSEAREQLLSSLDQAIEQERAALPTDEPSGGSRG